MKLSFYALLSLTGLSSALCADTRVYYVPNSQLKPAAMAVVAAAATSIDVAANVLTDAETIGVLAHAASTGKTVRAILDVTAGTSNLRAAAKLHAAGALVYSASFADQIGNHLLIADGGTVATGNYYWSARAEQLGNYLLITSDTGVLALSGSTYSALLSSATSYTSPSAYRAETPVSSFSVAFSPGGGIAAKVIAGIDAAQSQIRVAAYTFTSMPLAAALIRAKQRGVDVRIIQDSYQSGQTHSLTKFLQASGLPVQIDGVEYCFHSKYVVIDGHEVTTGSYNWSVAAENENAEDCLFIESPDLAAAFLADWTKHSQHSRGDPPVVPPPAAAAPVCVGGMCPVVNRPNPPTPAVAPAYH